ncbi:hypothetical protein JCM10207_003963 [Rhodosporidiobolus poonsookiae]
MAHTPPPAPTLSPSRPSPSPAGLPPIAATHPRHGPRDSLASVLSLDNDPASSPAVSRFDTTHPDLGADADADADEAMLGSSGGAPDAQRAEWAQRDEWERDLYTLAEAYFRSHELLRAAHVLRECTGPRARWLRGYAQFLAGEKRLQEEAGELLGPKDRPQPNPFTQDLLDDMASWEAGFVDGDGYLLYLKALLLLSLPPLTPSPFNPALRPPASSAPAAAPLDMRLAALETLVKSVERAPWNWSAWVKIAECLDGVEELSATLPFLPPTYPLLFFYVHASLELHSAGDALHDVLDELEGVFGPCSVVKGLRALVYYHVRDFDDSSSLFASLQTTDPYRLDDVDILSNILYVSEKRAELAALAQEYTRVERARPEVCCLIGNYYSLRRDHEKAIVYFRRALKLDRGYLSAWTLMGHEYVEIKNTNAAVASYRRAVDVNRKDYRAWYGLGQTYELLGEPLYALDYYQRAAALRPYDPRMWVALAGCYEKLKRLPDAIRSHLRALSATEPGEGFDTSLRIGKLLSASGDSTRAAAYHRRALAEGQRAGLGVSEMGRVWGWLVRWEIARERARVRGGGGGEAEGGDLEKAEEYLRVLEGAQEYRDEAKALRKEVEVLLRVAPFIDAWKAAYPQYEGKMELVLLEKAMSEEGAFDEAVKGCEVVVHVASPAVLTFKTSAEDEILEPAINGALSLLESANKAGSVKSVVLTSSVSAHGDMAKVMRGERLEETVTSESWNPMTYEQASKLGPEDGFVVYSASKGIAERAAWEWVKRENNPFAFSTIAPSWVLGRDLKPNLTSLNDFGSSPGFTLHELWKQPGFPPRNSTHYWPEVYVSLADTARAHLLAALKPANSNGKRYPLIERRADWPHLVQAMVKARPELVKYFPPVPDTLAEPRSSFDFVADLAEKDFGFKYEPFDTYAAAFAEQVAGLAKVNDDFSRSFM